MKDYLTLTFHENNQDILIGLTGLCVVLFMATVYIAKPAFSTFPAEPFYYMKSLPISYWIGISVAIVMLLIPADDKFKIVSVIMFGLYLHGLAIILYDNPRFADVYLHGSSILALLNNSEGSTYDQYYSKDYPGSFVAAALYSLITKVNDFTLLKSLSLFLVILPGALVYLLARNIFSKFASLVALAFFATFFNDQGHFSPQLFALTFYLLALYGLQRIYRVDSKTSRVWAGLITVVLAIINISNPTSSYLLFANLLGSLLLIQLWYRSSKWHHHNIIKQRALAFLILDSAILTVWIAYIGTGMGLIQPADLLTQSIESLITGKLSKVPLHSTTPNAMVLLATYIDYTMIVLMVVIGIMTFLTIYLRRKKSVLTNGIPFLIVLAALFILSLFFSVFALFHSSSATFILRAIMFASLAWSIALPFYFSLELSSALSKKLKYIPIIFAIASATLMPITKYGADYLSFIPSSEIYIASFIDGHSNRQYRILPLTENTWHVFVYYSTLHHQKILERDALDYREAKGSGSTPLSHNLLLLDDWSISHPYQLVISFGYMNSLYKLHEGDNEYLKGLEDYMKSRYNLISYAGDARTYLVFPR